MMRSKSRPASNQPDKLQTQNQLEVSNQLRGGATIKKHATNIRQPLQIDSAVRAGSPPLSLATTINHAPHQSQQLRSWSTEDFECIQLLGKGKFGTVFLAREKSSRYVVALKKMVRSELARSSFEQQAKRQIQIHSTLRHQNVLRLFGCFSDDKCLYLVLEYAVGGELYRQLKIAGRMPEDRTAEIVEQVGRGLQYLHSKGVIHRDIKPENLLLSFGKVKIADFGWSTLMANRRETLCGTLDYLAPQMVRGLPHDATIDIWALGVLCFELAVGSPPFQTPTYEETYEKICNEEITYPQFLSQLLRNFLQMILVKHPTQRPSLEAILNHKWLLLHSKENHFENV